MAVTVEDAVDPTEAFVPRQIEPKPFRREEIDPARIVVSFDRRSDTLFIHVHPPLRPRSGDRQRSGRKAPLRAGDPGCRNDRRLPDRGIPHASRQRRARARHAVGLRRAARHHPGGRAGAATRGARRETEPCPLAVGVDHERAGAEDAGGRGIYRDRAIQRQFALRSLSLVSIGLIPTRVGQPTATKHHVE